MASHMLKKLFSPEFICSRWLRSKIFRNITDWLKIIEYQMTFIYISFRSNAYTLQPTIEHFSSYNE